MKAALCKPHFWKKHYFVREPKVNIVIGKVKIVRGDFKKVFRTPRTIATISAVVIEST